MKSFFIWRNIVLTFHFFICCISSHQTDPGEDKILLQSKKNRVDIHRRLDHDRGGVHSRLDRTNVRSRLGKAGRSPVQTSDSFMSQRRITVRPKIQAVEQTSKPPTTVKVSIPEKEEDMFASSEEGSMWCSVIVYVFKRIYFFNNLF